MTEVSDVPAPSEFDQATAAHAVDGGWAVEVGDGWRIGGGVNGGYLLALVARAATAAAVQVRAEHAEPLAVSAHYASATRPGPGLVRTEVVRSGRGLTTVQARLEQGGEPRLAALVTCGDLGSLTSEVDTTAQMPQVPPLEECRASEPPQEMAGAAPLLDRYELRLDPATAGWAVGKPSGQGVIQGWFRLHGRDLDPFAALLAVDALPPVSFDLGRPGWAPTVQLSVHVRARPVPGWVLVRHATRNIAGGYFEEDAEIWDSAGRLVAQSRQLAGWPREV